MSADHLDDVLVKVARVAEEGAGNVIGVLQTFVDIIQNGDLRTLAKLVASRLCSGMHILDPGVVSGGAPTAHVVLEDDNVRVWDLDGIGR